MIPPTTAATRWINEYGSIMDLWQADDGAIVGLYASSTGSTGTYLVVGWAAGAPPSAQCGQSVSLSIYWRSLDGGAGDPSWHWVSGLGGQRLLGVEGQPDSMPLSHAMVATTDFPGLAGPGTYIDKLLYRAQGPSPAGSAAPRVAGGAEADPVDGLWQCREEPGLRLTLRLADSGYGYVEGTLLRGDEAHPVRGVTDGGALAAGLDRQGVAVTAPGGQGYSLALAGSLARDGLMTLTAFTSQGTAPGNGYLQTRLGALTFVKAG